MTWAYPKGSPSLKLPFIFVCVLSQIAVWVLKRMRHFASLHQVDLSRASFLKGSTNTMISSTLKPGLHQPTYMPRMINSNVEIIIAGSSGRPQ